MTSLVAIRHVGAVAYRIGVIGQASVNSKSPIVDTNANGYGFCLISVARNSRADGVGKVCSHYHVLEGDKFYFDLK